MPDIYKKIKAEYLLGETSYRKLAAKYGVSLSSIVRRAKNEKWADLRKQTANKTNTKIVESVASQAAKSATKFDEIADMLLAVIHDGIKDGTLMATNAKGLRDITGAIKDLRDIKGIKSEADMQEQMARIEKLRKEASADAHTEDNGQKYGVLILPDIINQEVNQEE